jgi:hypothetical protein
MGFGSSRSRTVGAPRGSKVVLAVGQLVFINPGDARRPVSLTDEHGVPAATMLSDGDEVEIIAWRPRGSTGTRYRVRRRACGTDGWLAAEELRATAARPVPADATAPEPPSPTGFHGGGRPFGSRA